MVVRMRATKSHRNNRRSHHALKQKNLAVDKETGVPHLRHRMSMDTGRYKGRKVVDVVSHKSSTPAKENKKGGK